MSKAGGPNVFTGKKSFQLGAYLCSPVPMFPGTYVSRYLCSSVPMFPGTYVPRYLCFPLPMFPGTYVARTYVPRYLCSPVPMFPEPMFPGTSVGTSTYFLYLSKSTSNRRKSYSSRSKSTHTKNVLEVQVQSKQMYLKYRQKYINKCRTSQLNF